MDCHAVTAGNLETQKHLLRFRHRAAKGKAGFLRAEISPAFNHHISALSSKLTTMGNRPVGSVQQFLSFKAKRFGHRALPSLCRRERSRCLSATDAYGHTLSR